MTLSALRRGPPESRADFVREIADDVSRRIREGLVSEPEARELAASLRFQAELLLPERMEAFDRIYGSRFERLIRQFLRARADREGAGPHAVG